MDRFEKIFIDNMKHLRKESGLTQEGMADLLGITRSRLGSYEEHRVCPPVRVMLGLCLLFDVDIMKMLTERINKVNGKEPNIQRS